jgi:CheY-like chemotaxis protein/HPt (histidine-containing phosphotransfer) domain-containing protein
VLLNLLGNAIKFTQSGSVRLRVVENGDVPGALCFSVTDTGIGIAADKLGQVFERFTQADSSTTRRFGGSGLGLTICRRLVELMSGRIWVESRVDHGSLFSFAIPFEVSTFPVPPVVARSGAALATELPRLRILMAEDSADNVELVLAYLEGTPFEVEVAENGLVACQMLEQQRFDLVLMDRQMPVMDGLTATRTIRAWETSQGRVPTPIIALTASAFMSDRETCLSAGCTAYLTKPIRQDVLLQAIIEHATVGRDSTALPAPAAMSPRLAQRLLARRPAYLANCRANVVEMREAVVTSNFQTLDLIGHNLRGSGGSFGLQQITVIGTEIEKAAGRADRFGALRWVDELSATLDQLTEGAPHRELP